MFSIPAGMTRTAALVISLIAVVAFAPAASAATTPSPAAKRAESTLLRVQALKHGVGVRTGRELTPALLQLAVRKHSLPTHAQRVKANGLLARPTDPTDPDWYGNDDPTYATEVSTYCPAASIYCFHWVDDAASPDAPDLTDTTPNNGVPDYIDTMAGVFDDVHACENTTTANTCSDKTAPGKGWPAPDPDGSAGGGSNKFDVYLKDVFDQGFYGYASPDGNNCSDASCPAYMVMDNDFSRFATGTETGTQAMQVTAAHEYNHTLQFAIDPIEDSWMFEATAVFFEEVVYPSINDYLQYIQPWEDLLTQPMTSYPNDNFDVLKVYGDGVWNHWLASRYGADFGDDVILDAWQAKDQLDGGSFAPGSYSDAIAAQGGTSFSDDFDQFSANVAEWQAEVDGSAAPGGQQHFPDEYPDVPTRPDLPIGPSPTSATLDHTTFAFRNVPVPASSGPITLHATLPNGLTGAIALVGGPGADPDTSDPDPQTGPVTTAVQETSSGGTISVTLNNPSSFSRITAVLVNSDVSASTYNSTTEDWNWTRDGQTFSSVYVSSGQAPDATTSGASGVDTASATLNGAVNPNGQDTSYYFQYGTTTSYGSQAPTSAVALGAGASPVAVANAISGLTPSTTYHFRVVAQSVGGIVQGADQTFTTGAAASQPPGGNTTPPVIVKPVVKPLTVTLSLTKSKLKAVLAKGLKLKAGCKEKCTVTLKLVVTKKLAKKLHLRSITLGTVTVKSTGKAVAATLHLTKKARKALAHARSLNAHVLASAVAPDKRKVSLARAVSLKK